MINLYACHCQWSKSRLFILVLLDNYVLHMTFFCKKMYSVLMWYVMSDVDMFCVSFLFSKCNFMDFEQKGHFNLNWSLKTSFFQSLFRAIDCKNSVLLRHLTCHQLRSVVFWYEGKWTCPTIQTEYQIFLAVRTSKFFKHCQQNHSF